ncbi:MAG: ChaN family lipoprotein [Candidatus Cloacimonetes bacterium]|nr:ChaN family lipoprotein [Candidatus Cloacimonadota bacterium]MDD2229088.1 ChaN family lipoprotein [Candidatus Cloacimonadota bacterium]
MRFIVLLITLLSLSLAWAGDLRIVQAKDGKTLTLQNLAKGLEAYDIIFFGEFHDNTTLHQLERDILPLLDGKRELVLSFEMFERDVQQYLTDYVEDKIDEASFLENSRPWGNYDPDYRPLVEYARMHKLNAIAANVPRIYAGKLARQGMGFLEEMDAEERTWLALKITAPDDEYKTAFYTLMGADSSPMHAMSADINAIEPIYQAQCLKDDTMAESIVFALKAKPKARLIHFNGDFHSHAFLGTVSRVKEALPKLKIAVISPVYAPDWQNQKLSDDDKQAGTYIIYLPEPLAGGDD